MKKIISILFISIIAFSSCKKGEVTQPSNVNSQVNVANTLKVKGEASVNCSASIGIFRDNQTVYEKAGVLVGTDGNYEFTFDYELQSGDNILFAMITDAGCGPAVLKTYLYVDGALVKSQVKACEVGGVSYIYP